LAHDFGVTRTGVLSDVMWARVEPLLPDDRVHDSNTSRSPGAISTATLNAMPHDPKTDPESKAI
jgi:hypothetical protein